MVPTLGFSAPMHIYFTVLIGLVAGLGIGSATEYCTSHAFYPTQSIAKVRRCWLTLSNPR
jgi:Na+/H+-translocating membrane pyrophosphatase